MSERRRFGAHDRPKRDVTPTQAFVLECMCAEMSAEQIAHALGVSVRTVEHHKRAIYLRLGLHGAHPDHGAIALWAEGSIVVSEAARTKARYFGKTEAAPLRRARARYLHDMIDGVYR